MAFFYLRDDRQGLERSPNGENFTPEVWARLAQHDKGTRSLFVVCGPEGAALWPLGPFFRGGGGEVRHATLSAPLSASLHASFGSVAFLWGARKATDSPMSVDLVVDHIAEGDRTNYAVDNLQ